MRIRKLIFCAACVIYVNLAWSKVFVRWSEDKLPDQKTLGVANLVIAWGPDAAARIHAARERGFQVYVEVPLQELSAASPALAKPEVAGVIINPGTAQPADVDSAFRALRSAAPKLVIRVLRADGKQPQMRGQTISTRNGILQVSSPTAQPWLDSNLAMMRFEQEFHAEQNPLYSFHWELGDSLQQQSGPTAADYSLAIAESEAIHADLVLDLNPKLQKGLVENQPSALETWRKVKPFLTAASANSSPAARPWANVGVVTDNYDAAYEPMNLMGRHNIPFRILPAARLSAQALHGLDVVAVFSSPAQKAIDVLANFAAQGGTVVLVNLPGKYPWQSNQPVQSAEHALSFTTGKGRVIELSEPITDPETFAQDVRRLLGKQNQLISLWNALTTLGIAYRDDRTGELAVELVNYAQEPLRVQVELKGSFSSIRYESPDGGCCQALKASQHDGFTDFVVPSLNIGGRVRLKPVVSGQQVKSKSTK